MGGILKLPAIDASTLAKKLRTISAMSLTGKTPKTVLQYTCPANSLNTT
jgi:hypothetical protein